MPDVADALQLAARGWSVLPVHVVVEGRCSCGRVRCPSPGKHPRVRWENEMSRAATPAEIEAWWTRWPAANVGIVTGWVSGLVVVDVDPRHDGDRSLATLEGRHTALPETVTSCTGGGGRHLWFAHPPHLVPSRPLAAGLDLKAEGGMVVAPPSGHASGGTYRWLAGHTPGDIPLAALPGWLDHLSVTLGPATGAGAPPPLARTPAERAAFASLWADVGLDVRAGDTMEQCPFHDDHHPSLHIDADGCRWFCFGCRRGGGIQALRRLVRPESEPGPITSSRGSERSGAPTLASEIAVDVVGESAHQDELLDLTGGRRSWSGARRRVLAELVPQSDNPFDPNAVAVVIEDRVVGHLPRAAASTYRPVIVEAISIHGTATCVAEIRGGWERVRGDVGRFGVVVHLPRP